MGDAAGEAAHRFHLLELHHGLLDPLALDDFVHQAVVGLGQRVGALGDARFERLVEAEQGLLALLQAGGRAFALGQQVARLVLAAPRAQGGGRGAAQGLGVERTLEQDDVAELVEAGARAVLRHAEQLG